MRYTARRLFSATTTMALLVTGLLLGGVSVDAKGKPAKKGKPYNDEYSMEVVALKGPEDTEVTVTLSTSDPVGFPIPTELKKLQVKIKDEDDEVVYIVNEKNVEVSGDAVVRLVSDGLPRHRTLRILAIIDAGRSVVLEEIVPVLLRPDLVILNANAPEEVNVDQAFNVDVNIKEMNYDVGVTATVSLYADGALSASVPGVRVDAGEMTTVVFAGLSFSSPGTKDLNVVISDAVPGEYDVSNNEHSFSIEVLQPNVAQDTHYYLSYYNYDDYYYYYWDNYYGGNYVYNQVGSWDNLYLDAYTYGDSPSGTIDEVTWQVGTENGVAESGSVANLSPYYSSPGYNYYYHHDNSVAQTWLYVYSYPGHASFHLNRYSGHYVYVYSYYGQTYQWYENYGAHTDAHSQIDVSFVIRDDGVTYGGSASAPVSHHHYSDRQSGTHCYYYYGCYDYYWDYDYDYYWAYGSGLLTPPALSKLAASKPAPTEVSLGDSHPNPFNPATSIDFSLPVAADVTLEVYNTLGQKVATLVEGTVTGGFHQVQFDASHLSSGLYFYVFRTGGFEEVKKMMLLK